MSSLIESHPPFRPFEGDTAITKSRLAEDSWNSRDPYRMAIAYPVDSARRNRAKFIPNKNDSKDFLTCRWVRELKYCFMKESWVFDGATELLSVLPTSGVMFHEPYSDRQQRELRD